MTAPAYSPGAARLLVHTQLIDARRAQRVTQVALAGRLGIDPRTFQRWENSEVEVSAIDLFRWAAALGLAARFVPIDEHGTSAVSASDPAPSPHLATPALAAFHYGERGPAAADCHVNRASAHSLAGHA